MEYTDLTPALALSATRGLLALDDAAARALGVERSFWVALALCYVEYLGEREVSYSLFLSLSSCVFLFF